VLAACLVPGCLHSSGYEPKHDGTARLVIQSNILAISKNGQIESEAGDLGRLLACTPKVTKQQEQAQSDLKSGRVTSAVGSALVAVSPLVAGALLRVAIPFLAIGANQTHHGHAALVDAVNMHNDDAECRGRAVAPLPEE